MPDVPHPSSVFTSTVLLHEELVATLAHVGKLNVTQYRVLLKTHELKDRARVGDVAVALSTPQNVTSKAATRLETLGLLERTRDLNDGRATILAITDEGLRCIQQIDEALDARFSALFSALPADMVDTFRSIIRAIGSGIEGDQAGSDTTSISSTYLTTIAQSYELVQSSLSEAVGASLSECRVLQRLHEIGDRARIVDLSTSLVMRSDTVTRAADRLEGRGWVTRITDPGNLMAVYLQMTPSGARAVETIQSATDSFMEWRILRHLTEQQQATAYEATRLMTGALAERRKKALSTRGYLRS